MADITSLLEIAKQINKKYEKVGVDIKKTSVVQAGVLKVAERGKLSLGSPSLDFMVYGYVPEGRFIEIYGDESSGKTTIAFGIAASFIKRQKTLPVEERRHVLFVDAEGTADPEWSKTSAGYNMNDQDVVTFHMTPIGQSAEQILNDVMEFVKSGKIGLVIFDSLVSIASGNANDKGTSVDPKSMEDKDMGGISKVMADFVKRNTGVFNRFRTTFIGLNGPMMNIGGYGNPETTPGGKYWRRACSLRLKTKRGASFDEDGKEIAGKSEKSPVGHIIEVALIKTKFCRWDRRLGRCHLNYVRGFDILQDTIDVAMAFDIIKKVSTGWYAVTDPDTGEYLTDKIHGEGNIKPFFEEHPDIWRRTYDKIYELMSIKDSPNSVSFEKMLDVDLNELFNMNIEEEAENNG